MKVGILAHVPGFLGKQKPLVCICYGDICKSKLAVDTAELEVEGWIIWSECDVANKILSVVDKTLKISLEEVRNQTAKEHRSQVGRQLTLSCIAILEAKENSLVPIQSALTLDFMSIDILSIAGSIELVVTMTVSEDESLRPSSSEDSLNSGYPFPWLKMGEASGLSDKAASAYKDPIPEAILLFIMPVPRPRLTSLGRLTSYFLSARFLDGDGVATESGDSADSGDSRYGLFALSETGLKLRGIGVLV